MKHWRKLVLPGVMLLGVSLLLVSCQTTSEVDSSAIEAAVNDTWKTACALFQQAPVTSEQFNTAPQWVRDYLVATDAVWAEKCAG